MGFIFAIIYVKNPVAHKLTPSCKGPSLIIKLQVSLFDV